MKLWLACVSALLLAGCGEGEQPPRPDGLRMLEYAQNVVSFGQRTAGSEELNRTRRYVKNAVTKEVEELAFSAMTPAGLVGFCNLQVTIPGRRNDKFVIISGHYDLKNLDPPMDGANDGASSAAVLIELANLIENPPFETRIVFFDGEECIGENYSDDDGLYGSVNYSSGLNPERCVCQINVDMVGGKNLKFTFPDFVDPVMFKLFMDGVKELGREPSKIVEFRRGGIIDDHTPFEKRGIRCINLIGFGYPYWHTPEDTIDKLSPNSLEFSASLVLRMLERTAALE